MVPKHTYTMVAKVVLTVRGEPLSVKEVKKAQKDFAGTLRNNLVEDLDLAFGSRASVKVVEASVTQDSE